MVPLSETKERERLFVLSTRGQPQRRLVSSRYEQRAQPRQVVVLVPLKASSDNRRDGGGHFGDDKAAPRRRGVNHQLIAYSERLDASTTFHPGDVVPFLATTSTVLSDSCRVLRRVKAITHRRTTDVTC